MEQEIGGVDNRSAAEGLAAYETMLVLCGLDQRQRAGLMAQAAAQEEERGGSGCQPARALPTILDLLDVATGYVEVGKGTSVVEGQAH